MPPEGLSIAHGLAVPVLIAVAVGIVATFLARRTRFGRYVFALGGNPEAAELSGVDTRRVTVRVFVLMGALCAVAAAISTARLDAATNAQGTLDELYVIAATVIGGTSLGGGLGTVAGAMLGALVMQSLQSGMVLMGLDTPLQNIVVGRGAGRRGVARPALPLARAEGGRCMSAAAPPLVEMRGMAISFGGVRAVDDVSLDLYRGEVVGLLGHNGAGKSTLIKMLSGAYQPDAGEIRIEGRPAAIRSPRDARRHGIETIYQTLALAENLDAAANLFLGRELLHPWGTLDDVAMEVETRKVMARLNPHFAKFKEPVRALSGGQRQAVAIARAIHFNARVLIMDEPTAALGPQETQQVAELIAAAQEGGDRHLPDQPRHPRRVRSRRPRGGDEERPARRQRRARADLTKDEVLGMIILGTSPPAAIPGPGAVTAGSA